MPFLTITEYSELGYTNKTQHASFPGVGSITAEQSLSISGSTAQCSALQNGTKFVELCADTSCYLAFGTNPTALANVHYLPSGQVRIYAINNPLIIAAIT